MFNVLVAYSKRNLDIGYCQGFNFILKQLMFDSGFELEEEEAFWVTNIFDYNINFNKNNLLLIVNGKFA